MDRKGIAQETLKIQQSGYYEINGRRIDISSMQKASEKNSVLIVPDEGVRIVEECKALKPPLSTPVASYTIVNQSTVQAVLEMSIAGNHPGVLNFASAKNPGGGFLGGAMAQEEALAASSGLYNTLLRHGTYYRVNCDCGTMMYTDHAIYSPGVVFFRDSDYKLLEKPVTASVLTLPAVNMGQVILKGEDTGRAKTVMLNRMRLSLAIFAKQKNRNLILGAYGCGVFRNDPADVAKWWKILLEDEGYGRFFYQIVFAILDRSKTQANISVFNRILLG